MLNEFELAREEYLILIKICKKMIDDRSLTERERIVIEKVDQKTLLKYFVSCVRILDFDKKITDEELLKKIQEENPPKKQRLLSPRETRVE